MSGTEVFEAIVAVRPELERRFVFMSGDVFNPELRAFVEQHGIGLLAKPFDRDTVRRTLDINRSGGAQSARLTRWPSSERMYRRRVLPRARIQSLVRFLTATGRIHTRAGHEPRP